MHGRCFVRFVVSVDNRQWFYEKKPKLSPLFTQREMVKCMGSSSIDRFAILQSFGWWLVSYSLLSISVFLVEVKSSGVLSSSFCFASGRAWCSVFLQGAFCAVGIVCVLTLSNRLYKR